MTDLDDGDYYMLTTVDNPWNPFTSFKQWHAYDANCGYDTPSFLARILQSSDEISPPDQELALEYAIEEIIQENVNGLYRKVSKNSAKLLGLK
jgi:hypothetical protein